MLTKIFVFCITSLLLNMSLGRYFSDIYSLFIKARKAIEMLQPTRNAIKHHFMRFFDIYTFIQIVFERIYTWRMFHLLASEDKIFSTYYYTVLQGIL